MYLPIGRTESEVSSLRHFFEPSFRLQQALLKWVATFRGDVAKGATLFSPKLERSQAERWLHDYSSKIMELTSDVARAERKTVDLLTRPYMRHQPFDAGAPRLPTLDELNALDASYRAQGHTISPPAAALSSSQSSAPASGRPSREGRNPADADAKGTTNQGRSYGSSRSSSEVMAPAMASSIPQFPELSRDGDVGPSLTGRLQEPLAYPLFISSDQLPSLEARAASHLNGMFYSAYLWCLWDLGDPAITISLTHHLVESYVSQGVDSVGGFSRILQQVYTSVNKMMIEQTRGKTQARIVYLVRWMDAIQRRPDSTIMDYLKAESLAWLRCQNGGIQKHSGGTLS